MSNTTVTADQNQGQEENAVITCERCFCIFTVPSVVLESRKLELCMKCFLKSPVFSLQQDRGDSKGGYLLKPIIVKPDHIDGKIYLGGYRCAMTRSVLTELNITRIIVCGTDLKQYFAPVDEAAVANEETTSSSSLEYLQFALEDEYEQPITHCFEAAHEFISNSPGNILVHCHAGVSRSATIVLSYLMKYKSMAFEDARNFVKSKRRCICPNPGFTRQLIDYQRQLEASGILPIVEK
jgi:protein-tyrosine phosphatase